MLTAAWWASALLAALALVGLVVFSGAPGLGPLALRADTAFNQMTGIGSTPSALTVKWTAGLLNAQNQPITSDTTNLSPNADRQAFAANQASATSPLSFMYSDFENLQVTVSQTENVTHQGITVSWTGAQPSSSGAPFFSFMQMMECYGDSATGPSPEDCEYGSQGMLGAIPNLRVGDRIGYICSSGQPPSTTSPASGPAGPAGGCDTNEPTSETPAHCDPSATGNAACSGGQFSIPFVPADSPADPIYGQTNLTTQFNQFNSNEVQAAYTSTDGTGQRQFEALTADQSSGLGCGAAESGGQTRSCWLVIVPRGLYQPNGFKSSQQLPLNGTPLSAGNWAQRIQIHLDYAPLSAACPPTVVPDAMVGTQVVFRAVTSWQRALNQAAACATVYSYTASTENESTTQLQGAGSPGNAGLAFTTIPIGSELARQGGQPPPLPTILYAPVAVTAIDLGFNINQAGQLTTPVKLTPALLAKGLNQVYQSDLPDYDPGVALPGPTWAQQNPLNMTVDPAFQALNSEVSVHESTNPMFPLITGDHSADNQRVWQWIQSDPATVTWLDGGTDPSNTVTADPAFVALNLGQSSTIDNFNEAYGGQLTCGQAVTNLNDCGGPIDQTNPTSRSCTVPSGDAVNPTSKACDVLDSEDMLPVETNFDQAAAAVLAGSDTGNTRVWDTTAKAPDGSSGWFGSVGTELPGQTLMWTVNDMPDLASYGLISAALCDPSGATCTQPSTDSVTTALNSAAADSAGLLQVNPAKVPSGGYPLVDVVYAAVPTDQPAAALTDYANFIAYAAGQGQTTGSAPGDLPPGYLPLSAGLQTQAQSVVKQLRQIASGTSSPPASPTPSQRNTGQTTTGGGSRTTGGTVGGGSTTTGSGTTGGTTGGGSTTGPQLPAAPLIRSTATSTGSSSATAQPFDVLPPSAQAVAGTTPDTAVGSVRSVLIIVAIIGAAGGLSGGVLRYGDVPGLARRFRGRADGS